MSNSWLPVSRSEAVEVLFGEVGSREGIRRDSSSIDGDYLIAIHSTGNLPPVATTFLLRTNGPDLFAWVSAYAEVAFPLSQFCRVCLAEDWDSLGLEIYAPVAFDHVHPIWASLILGEMLGQSEADADVGSVPLGRAAACYSFAVARSHLIYPSSHLAHDKVVERLSFIERDHRTSTRPLRVQSLISAWHAARGISDMFVDQITLLSITRLVETLSPEAAVLLRSESLQSDSAEDRVVGFDSVFDAAFAGDTARRLGERDVAIALAAAAIIAGRGTGHIGLLRPAARLAPQAVVWFGLLAGALGPKFWDKAWFQQTKGIERAMRQSFVPSEPPLADIAWPEFEWLTSAYESQDVFALLPKNTQRSMSIELLPGVSCQFRIGGRTAEGTEDRLKESRDRRAAARSQLEAARALLTDAYKLLIEPEEVTQSSLFDQGSSTGVRPKRSTGTRRSK